MIKQATVAAVAAAAASFGGQAAASGTRGPAYDVCVNAATDARLTSASPQAGDRVTAVGMVLPAGTIPSDGSGDTTCVSYQSKKIGRFYVNGVFVSSFPPNPVPLPQAEATDLAYVAWHFEIDGHGAFDTTGHISQFVQDGTYPQTLVGGTGEFTGVSGTATTVMLGAGGFQIRVLLP